MSSHIQQRIMQKTFTLKITTAIRISAILLHQTVQKQLKTMPEGYMNLMQNVYFLVSMVHRETSSMFIKQQKMKS